MNVENAARNVRHQLHQFNKEPSDPKTLNELIIPDRLRLHLGEDIIKYDGSIGGDRILVFTTTHLMDVLRDSKDWGCDGTFSVVPKLFDQLWCLHVRLAHTFVPVVYCLLNSRTESIYTHVLNILKTIRVGLEPKSISLDFENAELNAFKKVFPEIEHRACFFHLQQSVYRKLCKLNLKQLYETNTEFRLEVNMIPALAFIPTENVAAAFQLLNGLFYVDHIMELLAYFEKFYVGEPLGNGL
jgi:hypothetical protein